MTPKQLFLRDFDMNTIPYFRGTRLYDSKVILELNRSEDLADDVVELQGIVVPKCHRRQGYGSKAMRWLVDIAEFYSLSIVGEIEPIGDDPPGKTVLRKFYKGFGFRIDRQFRIIRKPTTEKPYEYYVSGKQ